MEDKNTNTPENFKGLTEAEVLEKLDGMDEEEKLSAVFNTAVGACTDEWTEAAEAFIQRAQTFGDHLTVTGKPDVLTLLGGMFGYFSLLERGIEELARDELMSQDKGSQTMIQQLDKLTDQMQVIKADIVQASDYMEWWLSLRMMRRELRLNVTEDGRFEELSDFEESKVEAPYLVKQEEE